MEPAFSALVIVDCRSPNLKRMTSSISRRLWVWKETKYSPSKLRPLPALGLIRTTTGKSSGTHTAPAVGGTHTPLPGSRLSRATGSTSVAVTSKADGTRPTTFSKLILRSAPMPPMSNDPKASLPATVNETGTVMGTGGGVGVGRGSWANAAVALPSRINALTVMIDFIGDPPHRWAVRLRSYCKQETRRSPACRPADPAVGDFQ